jgi:DNA ligase-1
VVKDLYDNREFNVGTGKGLTKKLKLEIWTNKEKYIGKIIKYKHQKSGAKDNPRVPSFQGFRDPRDMS